MKKEKSITIRLTKEEYDKLIVLQTELKVSTVTETVRQLLKIMIREHETVRQPYEVETNLSYKLIKAMLSDKNLYDKMRHLILNKKICKTNEAS